MAEPTRTQPTQGSERSSGEGRPSDQLVKRLGVGLVSLGWMGSLHTKAYQLVPTVFPELAVRPVLTHAADTAPDRAAHARDVLGYAKASADYRAVLDDRCVDVVSICAPNALHREIALAAAERGKPFWIEKPVGLDSDETADIAASATGLVTSVGFNYRWAPAVQRMRDLVTSGELGRITSARCVFLNGHAADPRVALSWRFQREYAGSGVLGDLLSHVADLLHYVVGPVAEVSATSTIVHPRRPIAQLGSGTHFSLIEGPLDDTELGPVENEDHAVALLRFACGAIGTAEVSRVVVGPRCGLVLEVYGTEGSATWDFERMNEFRLSTLRSPGYTTVLGHGGLGDYSRFQPGPGVAMGYDDLKVIEAGRFLAAVLGEKGIGEPSTVADALAAARVVQAAVDSAASGSWAQVKETHA